MYKNIPRIIGFIALVTLFFILPASCEQTIVEDGGGDNMNPVDPADPVDVDEDNDGLIDIRNLDMFNNIRFNLAGTSYDDEEADTDTGDAGSTFGGPTSATTACPDDSDDDGIFLCGYELMANLDFAQWLQAMPRGL